MVKHVLNRCKVRVVLGLAVTSMVWLAAHAAHGQPVASEWATPKRFTDLAPHPRLFVTPEQLERAIEGRGEEYAGVYDAVKAAAEAAVADSGEDPLAGQTIWRRAIRMQNNRIMSLVVQWHLTGDRRYIDAALQDVETMKDWMSPRQLTLTEGQFSASLAVVYDLLYDDLTEEERAWLIDIAHEYFIIPFLRSTAPGDRSQWIPGESRMWFQGQISNWNPVSTSGGGMLALAMYEHLPEAQTVIDRVNDSYQPIFDYLQETEGGWVEGLGYWNWAIRYMSEFLISYERASGERHAGFRSPGFRQTLTFGTYFVPHGEACGFGNNQHGGFSLQLLAAAAHLQDADVFARLQEFWRRRDETAWIKAGKRAAAAGETVQPQVRGGAYDLLLRPEKPATPALPRKNKVHTFPQHGWSMVADQWPNPTFYAAVRGGQLGGHHTHQDLLSWHGVVGIEKMIHNITESGYYTTAWADRAHEIYEKGSASKNTLFIGGVSAYSGNRHGQPARAETTRFQLPTGPALRLDATRAFWLTRDEPDLVCRLFTVIDDKGLLVLDRVLGNGSNPVEARAYTIKDAVFGENEVVLTGEFETARMTFASDQPAVLRRATALLTDGHPEPPTMIRWQTHGHVRHVIMATLLTRGAAPVDLKVGTSDGFVTVAIEAEDWSREIRLTDTLEMPAVEFGAEPLPPERFYERDGNDSQWQDILDAEAIPIGRNSTEGITGSRISVNRSLVEQGPYAERPVPQAIRIHTLGNSLIPRQDFGKWSRWYQEDGNTQVFRLFKGEHNVRNQRPNSARIEAFSQHKWKLGDGWQEWSGRYTLVNPEGAIFQVKAPGPVDWPVMIAAAGNDRIKIQRRRAGHEIVDSGQQFDLRVRDNGYEYEVYVNGQLEATGHYDRKGLHSTFRWGMYIGGKRLVSKDAMLMVSGAAITPGTPAVE